MARYTGPKQRLQRSLGEDMGLKTNAVKVQRRLTVPPGQHGHKGHKKMSDYGTQLKEKQKLRITYGVVEKQLRKYYDIATKTPASTGTALLKLLERRLDNVVYRLGFAPTRASARQLVAHNHILLNGKKANVPSIIVKMGDVITLKEKTTKIPVVASLLADKTKNVPAWVERQATSGKIVRFPERDEIDTTVNEQFVVEYYSR
ncbi:30S ribosomal protein S4 [Candidatus Cerribacteria bacterium 'Amazon FNV 2010 28 9']|uniref:Small ribosomal subunit protein uS4 n=1 Tax=Candidatus Cerribacteria bacterium 'Amazon FNV 2010 28 9' TaxID=2081795 RepID=A0A317JSD5_9BACT|nr:MAG: 30S ribosomal protein S4 [Candidatus Cerribacteria bacterium 'Amazon FNV 2010 28 9']